jgi:hypothetical protein
MTLTFSKKSDGTMTLDIKNPDSEAHQLNRDQAVHLLSFLTYSCFYVEDGQTCELDLADKSVNPALHSGSLFPTKLTTCTARKNDR